MQARDREAVPERRNLRLLGHSDLGGTGDGMHINVKDGYAFFAHQGGHGTSIVDVRDPTDPRLVGRIPAPANTHSHKVQILGDLLLVNRERNREHMGGNDHSSWTAGLSIYDVSEPTSPREISFWPCGGRGVHRMTYWSEPYAYVAAGSSEWESERQGLVILDLSDPVKPVEVGRWWYPGMRYDERELRTWAPETRVRLHHGIPRDGRLYCGWSDLGLVILDIEDVRNPGFVAHLDLDAVDPVSRRTHSTVPLPGRDALVITDEATEKLQMDFQARIVDISDESEPKLLSRFPVPQGDYATRGNRFGPHNVHEPRPGSFQHPDLVFMTYFNAGLRVFDVSDLEEPREVAYYVPEAPPGRPSIQMNDVFVDQEGLIYASDRYAGGIYVMELEDSVR